MLVGVLVKRDFRSFGRVWAWCILPMSLADLRRSVVSITSHNVYSTIRAGYTLGEYPEE